MTRKATAERYANRMLVTQVAVSLLLLGLFIYGVAAAWPWIERWLVGLGTIQIGLLASFVAGLFTLVGAQSQYGSAGMAILVLAVGIGFGGDLSDGATLAIAIGLQNMPEGLVVAIALLGLGYSKAIALGVTLLTGLVEPVGGLLGVTAVTLMTFLLPWAMAFAGGAMLFVISHEIIPESHRQGHEAQATLGVLIGFVTLLALDLVVG